MANDEGVEEKAQIREVDGEPPVAQLVFASTDREGSPGALNQWVLEQFGLGTDFLPTRTALSKGYALLESDGRTFCFVVTVGTGRPADLLFENLFKALQDPQVQDARSLWIPLMGTGAGRLEPVESRAIIRHCLSEAGWSGKPRVEITISGAPTEAPAAEVADVSSVDAYDAPRTQAADELLRTAARLRLVRNDRGPSLSTTLLFFALAESGSSEHTPALRDDPAARGFRVALNALAGERYQRLLTETFDVEALPSIGLLRNLPRPTDNVSQIMATARDMAESGTIGIHELISALLNFTSARYLLRLEALDITAEQLFAAYQDERSQFIESVLLSDVAGATDRLGYARYATAIAKFLTHEKTPPPLSISIQAPWGVGKSSLMQQIRRELDPKGAQLAEARRSRLASEPLRLKEVLRFLQRRKPAEKRGGGTAEEHPETKLWTVWFNAWKYDTSEQVWAGLVSAIVDQISDRLPLAERELFLLRLQLARIDDGIVRRKVHERLFNSLYRWIAYATVPLIAYAGLQTAGKSLLDPELFTALATNAPYLLGPVLIALAVSGYWQHRKARNEPASFSLAEYLQVPSYSDAVGAVHRIHEDLLRVLALTPRLPGWQRSAQPGTAKEHPRGQTPIVIFIDDLDRCTPSKIASVVEGVSMFLASDLYRCLFVIGMDPQLIAAALESEHGDVIEKLPSYERAVPLGWRFMDKFVQLPFTIPPSSSGTLENFVKSFSKADDEATVVPAEPQAESARVNAVGGTDPITQMREWLQWIPRRLGRSLPQPASEGGTVKPPPDAVASPSPPSVGNLESGVTLAAAARKDVESRDVGDLLEQIRISAAGNPRELKRMANLGRLYLQLRNVRRESEIKPWISPTLQQYSQWIDLASRWPDAMRWLLWGTDEATWPARASDPDLAVRRLLTLEDAAALAKNAHEWQGMVHAALRVPVADPSDWANDVKLYDFFKAEAARRPDQRISTAARMEFW